MLVIRVVMPRAIACRDGEDVCGWSMATADSVITSLALRRKDRAQTMKVLQGTKRKAYLDPGVVELGVRLSTGCLRVT